MTTSGPKAYHTLPSISRCPPPHPSFLFRPPLALCLISHRPHPQRCSANSLPLCNLLRPHLPRLACELASRYAQFDEFAKGSREATSQRYIRVFATKRGESGCKTPYFLTHYSLFEECLFILGVKLGILFKALVLDERHVGTAWSVKHGQPGWGNECRGG